MSREVYREWTQLSEKFNKTEAWQEDLFPDAEYRFMKEAGCLIVPLAIRLRSFGIETEDDEELFNPMILNERLIEVGAFDSAADLYLNYINKLYALDYIGPMGYSDKCLQMLIQRGNPFLICVPGVRGDKHFVAFDGFCEDGDIAILDPAQRAERLSDYETVLDLRVFRRHKLREETQSVFPDFNRSFERIGNPGADLAAAALAQEGKTGFELGYDYNWCAAFISDLAILIEQQQAIPWESFVKDLKASLLETGAKRVEEAPLPGDIVFMNRREGEAPNHVEIVYGTAEDGAVLSVGGNSGEDVSSPLVSCVCRHQKRDGITDIIRPLYHSIMLD